MNQTEIVSDMTFKEFKYRVRELKSLIKKQNLKTSDPRFTKMLVDCNNLIEWKSYLDLKSYFYEVYNDKPKVDKRTFRKRPVYKIDIKTKRIIWSYPSCASATRDHFGTPKGNHIWAAANAYRNDGLMHSAYGHYWIFVEDERWDV